MWMDSTPSKRLGRLKVGNRGTDGARGFADAAPGSMPSKASNARPLADGPESAASICTTTSAWRNRDKCEKPNAHLYAGLADVSGNPSAIRGIAQSEFSSSRCVSKTIWGMLTSRSEWAFMSSGGFPGRFHTPHVLKLMQK